MESKDIQKGMIVKYQDRWYQVTRVTRETVNLGNTWNPSRVYCKGIPKSQVTEDRAAWYKNWTESDAYQCM
jgi:translation elongation factor P/translation initiation factor 5A